MLREELIHRACELRSSHSNSAEIQLETHPPSQLQDHVNGGSSTNIVRLHCSIICQLFPRMNQSNLIHLDPFFFLQGLFHRKNLILWLEVHGLLAPGQCFDKNLLFFTKVLHRARGYGEITIRHDIEYRTNAFGEHIQVNIRENCRPELMIPRINQSALTFHN
jgi:hypothetical protein